MLPPKERKRLLGSTQGEYEQHNTAISLNKIVSLKVLLTEIF